MGKRPSATACLAMARWKEAGVAAASCTASVAHSLLWSTSAPWPAAGCSASTMDSGGAPGWSEAVESAALEAAGSSTRGSGWASSGLASSWECRAAQSRQARPEEAQEPSLGRCRDGALSMRRHCSFSPALALALALALTLTRSPAACALFCDTAWSKCPPWQCPSSAPVPPQGAPGGSGQLGAPGKRPAHWTPSHCLGCSS